MALTELNTSSTISGNFDEFPMKVYDRFDIEIQDETIARKYPFNPIKRGKWMLFFPLDQMNEMWQKALRLYRAGELTGIVSIKTSTAAANPRAGGKAKGAIRFACGPFDDEDEIVTYGRDVVAKMGYYSDIGNVAYKTDQQSAIGTRATGARRNYHYRITVPTRKPTDKIAVTELYDALKVRPGASQRDITKAYRKVALEVHPDKNKGDPTAEDKFKRLGQAYETLSDEKKRAMYDSKKDNKKIEIPSRTWTDEWLHENDDDIALQYKLDLAKLGRWTLIYPLRNLDVEWVKACKLYRTNELTGISFLKASTAKAFPGRENYRTGVIIFFCGPHKDEEAVMKYGRNLVQKLGYTNQYGNIQFKIESASGEVSTFPILYEIDLLTC